MLSVAQWFEVMTLAIKQQTNKQKNKQTNKQTKNNNNMNQSEHKANLYI